MAAPLRRARARQELIQMPRVVNFLLINRSGRRRRGSKTNALDELGTVSVKTTVT